MANESENLEDLAHRNGLLLKCSASVDGGLPAIESIKRISESAPVKSAEGVLNGTCNFVLHHLAAGWDFAEVVPRKLPAEHPLARVQGESNMLRLELDSGEELLVSGKGAGRWPTSESVFADLMEIYRYRVRTQKGNDGIGLQP